MFSPELENLIQATLEDGILEVKEKAALIKRAQAEGVDIAELEIYINSILQKRKREADKEKNAKQEQIAQKKKEALRKCPNCGESIPVMAISCPKCGYELSDQKAVSSVQILADKIEKISVGLREVQETDENGKNIIYQDIINTISMFPVPNNKQDIIEFLTLSCSKSKFEGGLWGTMGGRIQLIAILTIIAIVIALVGLIIGAEDLSAIVFPLLVFCSVYFFLGSKDIIRYNKVATAWQNKFEQVMLKARSLRADAEFTQQLDYFESLFNKNKQSNNSLLATFTSFKRK